MGASTGLHCKNTEGGKRVERERRGATESGTALEKESTKRRKVKRGRGFESSGEGEERERERQKKARET